jgi:hypothetical protein
VTDDPTTREAVVDDEMVAWLSNKRRRSTNERSRSIIARIRRALAVVEVAQSERAAATTAERERLRRIVAGMGKNEQWGDSVTVLKSQTYNAALADVTRALDTDTEGA